MPLTRRVSVAEIPPQGLTVSVIVDETQRAALAGEFELPAIERLEGRYHLTTLSGDRVKVTGTVEADVQQTCVVTLEPTPGTVQESVEVIFGPEESAPEFKEGIDPPDLIIGGTVDLGALTSEFFALGLDPYPRAPGVAFSKEAGGSERESAFSALERLRNRNETDR